MRVVKRALALAVCLAGVLAMAVYLFVQSGPRYATDVSGLVGGLTLVSVFLGAIVLELSDREKLAAAKELKGHLAAIRAERKALDRAVERITQDIGEALNGKEVQELLDSKLSCELVSGTIAKALDEAVDRVAERMSSKVEHELSEANKVAPVLERRLLEASRVAAESLPLLGLIVQVEDHAERGKLLLKWKSALHDPRQWRKVKAGLKNHGLLS